MSSLKDGSKALEVGGPRPRTGRRHKETTAVYSTLRGIYKSVHDRNAERNNNTMTTYESRGTVAVCLAGIIMEAEVHLLLNVLLT